MTTRFIRSQRIKAYMKESGLRTSAGFLQAFDREVHTLLQKYSHMAKSDRRHTVMAIDIDLPKTLASLSRGIGRGRL